jgi:poly-gamma-glutamate capsule biosynthesis protein CapA/YwtB (metallophosphatase superfamily)
MKRKIKQIFIILLAVALLLSLCACSPQEEDIKVSPQPEPIPAATIELVAVGDNLIHNTIYKQAAERAGGNGYDFTYAYQHVAPLIEKADLAFINQETPLATAIYKPSSYPLFNSPTEVGDAVVDMGFDIISQANNHMFDKGEKGLVATLDYWHTKDGVKVVGAYRDDSDLANIRMVEINGISLAFVAFTEMTNGLTLPAGSKMRYILAEDEELLKSQIQAAAGLADVVVVSAHWGNENTHEPTQNQRQLAQKMAVWGADIILGHHPHTLQPIEYIERENAGPALVVYSLGNFISAQHGANNMVGGIVRINIKKDYQSDPQISLTKVDFIPTITHYTAGVKNVTIYPLNQYTTEMAGSHGVRQYASFSYDYIQDVLHNVITDQFLANDY